MPASHSALNGLQVRMGGMVSCEKSDLSLGVHCHWFSESLYLFILYAWCGRSVTDAGTWLNVPTAEPGQNCARPPLVCLF